MMSLKSCLCLGALALAGCVSSLSGGAMAAETRYPLTLKNCGREIIVRAEPASAVTVGQNSTEILYMLGLADRVKGTSVWFAPVKEEFAAVNATVPRLADNDPGFETVVSKKPDLVAVQFQWHIGPEGIVARPEQFEALGIPVYTSPADCIGKDNSGGGDGVRHDAFSMELIYQEIRDLAQIFNVQDRGAALVERLQAREAAARAKVTAATGALSAVFWFSSAELDLDPYVAGRKGAPGYIMAALGIRNVVESDEEWPTVGWETIAKSNPTMIVAGKLDRRRFKADDIAVKRSFLSSDPVTKLMPAVRDGRIFELDAQAMNPTVRSLDGIEALADAIAAAGLTR